MGIDADASCVVVSSLASPEDELRRELPGRFSLAQADPPPSKSFHYVQNINIYNEAYA